MTYSILWIYTVGKSSISRICPKFVSSSSHFLNHDRSCQYRCAKSMHHFIHIMDIHNQPQSSKVHHTWSSGIPLSPFTCVCCRLHICKLEEFMYILIKSSAFSLLYLRFFWTGSDGHAMASSCHVAVIHSCWRCISTTRADLPAGKVQTSWTLCGMSNTTLKWRWGLIRRQRQGLQRNSWSCRPIWSLQDQLCKLDTWRLT